MLSLLHAEHYCHRRRLKGFCDTLAWGMSKPKHTLFPCLRAPSAVQRVFAAKEVGLRLSADVHCSSCLQMHLIGNAHTFCLSLFCGRMETVFHEVKQRLQCATRTVPMIKLRLKLSILQRPSIAAASQNILAEARPLEEVDLERTQDKTYCVCTYLLYTEFVVMTLADNVPLFDCGWKSSPS